ncbi:MAG TPA: response regulator [Vicinamibacterales bacterium]|nr:response regulator [Vicinamibacterales bacterium]
MAEPYILLVDDNPETLEFLTRALEGEGFKVRAVKSVFKAVELLHDGSPLPALIITDLLMPGTTGWDFMKHIRDDEALRSLPVIIVTGAEAGEGFALADAVIQKPLDMEALVKAIRTLWPPPGALPL